MRLAVVVNPTSGKGRGARVRDVAVSRFRDAGADVDVVEGANGAEALRLAHDAVARGLDALVAVGGDGMVHLALQAVAGTGTPLGIVAAGTGNDLATHLRLPTKNPVAAADVVLAGNAVAVDAVRAGDKWFGCILGAGFDSACNERANRLRWPKGDARYIVSMVLTLPSFRPVPFSLRLDGEPWDAEAMLVAVANASSYGGGMKVAPDADVTDGLLDVMVLGAISTWGFLKTFPSVFRGRHVNHPAVTVRRARVVEIDAAGVMAYADGEPFAMLPLRCECVPGALRVLVPPGT